MQIQFRPKEYYLEFLERICKTMDESGYDWKSKIYSLPNFEDFDDRAIFEGLCFAILTIQAVWNTYESKMDKLKQITKNFDVDFFAKLNAQELDEIYQRLKSEIQPRDRFLKRKLNAMRFNAHRFLEVQKRHGSFKAFVGNEIVDKESLISKLIRQDSEYKLKLVGLAICCEFFKNMGIDEFKPDIHMARLFSRTELLSYAFNKSPPQVAIRQTREIGWDFARKVGKKATEIDSILWQFCAEKKAEICTAQNPKCTQCRLSNTEPRFCKGFKLD